MVCVEWCTWAIDDYMISWCGTLLWLVGDEPWPVVGDVARWPVLVVHFALCQLGVITCSMLVGAVR